MNRNPTTMQNYWRKNRRRLFSPRDYELIGRCCCSAQRGKDDHRKVWQTLQPHWGTLCLSHEEGWTCGRVLPQNCWKCWPEFGKNIGRSLPCFLHQHTRIEEMDRRDGRENLVHNKRAKPIWSGMTVKVRYTSHTTVLIGHEKKIFCSQILILMFQIKSQGHLSFPFH